MPRAGHVLKFLRQLGNHLIPFAEERQLLVGALSFSLPALVAVNQIGKGHVMAAAGQREGPRAQRIADGDVGRVIDQHSARSCRDPRPSLPEQAAYT